VAGRPVESPASRREQRLEALRPRQHRPRWVAVQLQPTAVHQSQCVGVTSFDLLGVQVAPVTHCRRIDQRQQSFACRQGGVVIVAVLRTQVHGGFAGQLAMAEDVPEFAAVIVVKEDVVVHQREAACVGVHAPRHRRKRPLLRLDRIDRWLHARPQQSARQRLTVAVEHHRVCRQRLAVGQSHAAHAAPSHLDGLDVRAGAEDRAVAFGQSSQRAADLDHTAAHRPHTLRLHVRDQHQRRRGIKGRRSAVGGVAAEQLLQARVMKVLGERGPEVAEQAEAEEGLRAADAEVGHHAGERRPLRTDIGPLEGGIDLARLCAERQIAARLSRSGKGADGLGRALGVGEQIEPATAAPSVAGQHLHWLEAEFVLEPCTRVAEQALEHPAHGEDGGSGIDAVPARRDLSQLTAHHRGALKQRHVEALPRQICGRREPADAAAHHHHPMIRAAASHPYTRPL